MAAFHTLLPLPDLKLQAYHVPESSALLTAVVLARNLGMQAALAADVVGPCGISGCWSVFSRPPIA